MSQLDDEAALLLWVYCNYAVHTNAQVLHAGTMLDVRERLRQLVAEGRACDAARLWGSVLEVQHCPPPLPRRILSTTCLPVSGRSGQCPVSSPTAFVAARDAGGSKCHSLGPTAAQQSLFSPVPLLPKHGPLIMPVSPASLLSRWRGLPRACGQLIFSQTMRRPWLPGWLSKHTQGQYPRLSSGSSGGSGMTGSDGGRSPVSPYRLTSRLVEMTVPGRIGRCGCSLGPWRPAWMCSRPRVEAAGCPRFCSVGAALQPSVAIACCAAPGAFECGSDGDLGAGQVGEICWTASSTSSCLY